MGRMEGKVVLVTGGARGQGRSHAVRFAEEGADVVVTDVCAQIETVPYPMSTEEDLAETVRLVEDLDRRCLAVKADSRDEAEVRVAVDRAVAEYGRIDVLVVNHGIASFGDWEELTPAEWNTVIDVNLNSVWTVLRVGAPYLVRAGSGSIVITSSASGLQAQVGLLAYMAAKHGVVGLTKSFAAELAPSGVRVNSVAPTMVSTPMILNQAVEEVFSGGRENPTREQLEFPATTMNLLPIPWVEPRDVSNAVLFLASDEARYITGYVMPIDAGMVNQPPGVPPLAIQKLTQLEQLA